MMATEASPLTSHPVKLNQTINRVKMVAKVVADLVVKAVEVEQGQAPVVEAVVAAVEVAVPAEARSSSRQKKRRSLSR